MTKEKVQNKVQTIQWPKKKYKIKYRQSNDQRKSTKTVQTIQWPKKKYKNSTEYPMTKEKVQKQYRQSNDQRKSTK
jgi:hypothetical protein